MGLLHGPVSGASRSAPSRAKRRPWRIRRASGSPRVSRPLAPSGARGGAASCGGGGRSQPARAAKDVTAVSSLGTTSEWEAAGCVREALPSRTLTSGGSLGPALALRVRGPRVVRTASRWAVAPVAAVQPGARGSGLPLSALYFPTSPHRSSVQLHGHGTEARAAAWCSPGGHTHLGITSWGMRSQGCDQGVTALGDEAAGG